MRDAVLGLCATLAAALNIYCGEPGWGCAFALAAIWFLT